MRGTFPFSWAPLALMAASVQAQIPTPAEVLPPEIPWSGRSEQFQLPPEAEWATPSEASGLVRSPSYAETNAYLERLLAASPDLQRYSLGRSPQGREIWCIVASKVADKSPEALRRDPRPIVFAQAGIHAGEIDGKDAGLMLLRDMTVQGTRARLLEGAHFVFVPILNVDGHERTSAFSRINQRGPELMGWRTNARNLNLNRDYAKLDTPELTALVRALVQWQPDLYLDLHVTDGADYQYDITWGHNGPHAHSPEIATWLDEKLTPRLMSDLTEKGHIPGPLIFANEKKDLGRGIVYWTAGPRYSNGYGDAIGLPTVLLENHSLKPYRQRVLGTYVFLATCLQVVGKERESLWQAIDAVRERRAAQVSFGWRVGQEEPPLFDFKGIASKLTRSDISGDLRLSYTGQPEQLRIPYLQMVEASTSVNRPLAYWIPPAWQNVIERLRHHGLPMETIDRPRSLRVEMYRIRSWEWENEGQPFEGHMRIDPQVEVESRVQEFPAGSVRISTDHARGVLAMLLLEPESPDSFFRWGFFLEVLQRTEYAEAYVTEVLAAKMLERDPALRADFEAHLLADPEFARDPDARLRWFYERTPYFDDRWRLYPVAREP